MSARITLAAAGPPQVLVLGELGIHRVADIDQPDFLRRYLIDQEAQEHRSFVSDTPQNLAHAEGTDQAMLVAEKSLKLVGKAA